MAFGRVTATLRPLKLAMLVELNDPEALLEALRINTFLWGGTYNPIIPVFTETPENWSHLPLDPPSPRQIFIGYLRLFDPDIIVACGKLDPTEFENYGRTAISAADILGPIATGGTPGYGIGLFEMFIELAQQEFKYVRRQHLWRRFEVVN
jgi:hypothetical protein